MNKLIATAALALGLSALALPAAAATPQSCDRACLKGMLTTYLDAMVAHAPGKVPAAANVRFTEDTQDIKLGEGLWKTATGLGTYRQDFIDVRRGVAGSHVVVMEGANQTLLAVRLKVVNRRITEVETQVTHNQKEGSLFDLSNLKTVNPVMNKVLTGADRPSRDEIIYAAAYYPAGLKAGTNFNHVGAPFTADAYRLENGVYTAGPPCTRSAECKNISTQPTGNGRGGFQERLLAVDEDLGVAWLRMSWARTEGQRLIVYEAFKVSHGKMTAVEAFMKSMPVATTSGWD
jgi:hypothetical protein